MAVERRRRWTALATVATLMAVVVAEEADFPVCVNMTPSDLPTADFQACGLNDAQLWGVQYTLYTERKCATPACMRLYAFVDSANPAECYVDMFNQYKLRSRILAPLYASCAARTEAPSPATPSPRPGTPPAPAPAPTPAPPPPAAGSPPSPPSPNTPNTPPAATTAPTTSSTTTTSTTRPSAATTTTTTTTTTTAPPLLTNTTRPPSASESDPDASSPATPENGSMPSSSTSTKSPRSPPSANVDKVDAAGDQIDSPSSTMSAARPPYASSADAQARRAPTTSGGSSRAPVWIGVSAAAVAIVGIAVIAWVRQSRAQHSDAKLQTNASTHVASATDESGTAHDDYVACDDGPVSASDRKQIETILREDHILETWRLRSTTVVDKKFLGKGGHAYVHLVALPDGSHLASKRLVTNQLTARQFKQLVAEVHIVVTLKHRNIVRFEGVVWSSSLDFQVLFEYMEGGDLRSYIDKQKTADATSPTRPSKWPVRKLQMALDIAEGLTYAHSFNPPLVHRDLKSRNILLTIDLKAKISDFGVSRLLSENDTMTTGVGTNRWLAPEVISGGGSYTESCDIYSFGVVLTELDTYDVPLSKEMAESLTGTGRKRSEMWLLQEVAHGRLRPSMCESSPPEMRDLAMRCLAFDPTSRPNALEIAYVLRKLMRDASLRE